MARYGLCIGINNYPGTGSDLSGCVNDANDWAKALKKRGFTVDLLLDRKANGKSMRNAILDIVSRATSGDTVFIQYSGHGTYIPDVDGDESDGTDECLCPWDLMSNGPITDDWLFEAFTAKARGVKLIVASDSCHSGTVARFAPITTPPTMRGRSAPLRTVRFLPPATFLSKREASKLGISTALRRSTPPGRHGGLLMAGCQDAEYSYDAWFNGRANGAFTYVALSTLQKLPATATYAQWFKAIRRVLPSQQYPQRPNLFGSTSMKRWRVLV